MTLPIIKLDQKKWLMVGWYLGFLEKYLLTYIKGEFETHVLKVGPILGFRGTNNWTVVEPALIKEI